MPVEETSQEPNPVDKHGRGLTDLRISLTDRCNLRCTYCMPKEVFGPDCVFLKRNSGCAFVSSMNSWKRSFKWVSVRFVSQEEPLLRPGLLNYIKLLQRFKHIEDVAMTTNGVRLADKAGELKAAGLSRVTVSLDALDPEIVGEMNGRGIKPDAVLRGIDTALEVGLGVKVNMVVEKGVNDGEILPMASYFKERGGRIAFHRIHGRRQPQWLEDGTGRQWQGDP